MAVHLSGPVLASLCYEHANDNRDQEGLLLGQISNHVVDTISDSQMNQSKQETILYVMNYVACDRLFSWYDHRGHVIQEKLRALLPGDKYKEVIGWYKFRRNSTMLVSLRERAVHKHLKEAFPGIVTNNFLFCLFTSSTTSNLSTHSFDHNMLSFDGSKFNALPVTVENLKDTTSHEQYKCRSATTNLPPTSIFSAAVSDHRTMFLESSKGDDRRLKEVISIMTLNNRTQDKLGELMDAVSSKELALGKLKEEVRHLQERVTKLKPKPTYTCSKPVPPPVNSQPSEVQFIDIEMTIQSAGATIRKAKQKAAAAAAAAASAANSTAAAPVPSQADRVRDLAKLPPTTGRTVTAQPGVSTHKRSKSDIREDIKMLSLEVDPRLTGKQNDSLVKGGLKSGSQDQLHSALGDIAKKPSSKIIPAEASAAAGTQCLDSKTNQVSSNSDASKEIVIESSKVKTQEPFGFIDDLLVKAKSPTTSAPSSLYATLPRTEQAAARQTRSRSKETEKVDTKSLNGQSAKTQVKMPATEDVPTKPIAETLDITLSSSPTF